MARFNFIHDEKITVWERTQFVVEAETEEEARAIAAKKAKSASGIQYDDSIEIVNIETLDDTIEYMTPSENNNQPTVEIYINNADDVDNLVATNA